MSFVAKELKEVSRMLREMPLDHPDRERFYITQQALTWALDPSTCASPLKVLAGVDLHEHTFGAIPVSDRPQAISYVCDECGQTLWSEDAVFFEDERVCHNACSPQPTPRG